MAENKKPNRLIHQKSPYLLQHAYNPVDWYPWGEEAFSVAAAKDLPILLSIGYSTCHWCHVMAHESFEDAEVADLLNREYVAIKVDREERPDIDSIYMSVCQALTGQGGWPMTIIMTPDKKPFFAGTYFPKYNRMGMPGLISILERSSEAWKESRESLLEVSSQITDSLSEQHAETDTVDHKRLINAAYEQYKNSFDSMHGGFGTAPKFPSPHILSFLLRYWKMTGNEAALKMAEKTLDAMRRGGIFDHIGYGFCRYSTDRTWLIPHFEKMLYDNALIAIASLETYQAAGNGIYAKIAGEIFTYILRDMTSPEGGFYSAEDADSEDEEGHMEEGRFYTWTPEEVRSMLGEGNEAERFMVLYDITRRGNFDGRSIPNAIKGSVPGSDLEFVERCRRMLFESREKRKHPFKDDKILASWNGLMIAALAMGGRILGDPSYTTASEKAAQFILSKLVDENGRLFAVYRGDASQLKAYADDYTFMIWGLLELYETTYKPEYLQSAMKLNASLLELFWDSSNGGLFIYGSDSEQLIARPKEGYDGATPSANSVAANNFIRLARLTGKSELEDKALDIFKAFSGSMDAYPAGFSHMLGALIMLEAGGHEVIVTGKPEEGAAELIDVLRQGFRPFTVTMHYDKFAEDLSKLAPYIADYTTVEGKAAAYVCRNFTCNRPATDAAELRELLQ
ncbi:MAG TPA: thioredoxin domain-containing protein [Clostridia bacterium]|nr:thioredoxin domain-containing protein [Clostridia bacterium]